MVSILVVDDEERILKLLSVFLAKKGFDVHEASGGGAAIEVLRSRVKIELMIIDMKMPHITGLDVIKEKNRLKNICPVIMLTGVLSEEKDIAEFCALGLSEQDILYKPVDLFVLLDAVTKKLERKVNG
jgi:DNA-binding response OmpR family regulator